MSRIVELAVELKEIRRQHAEAKKILDDIESKWNEVDAELLEAMVEEGVKTMNVDGVGTVMMRTKNILSVTAAHKPEFFEYLKETGNEGLLKLDVNPRTLGSFLDEHLVSLTSQLVETGLDEVDARKVALEKLQAVGVSYFTKRDIALKGA